MGEQVKSKTNVLVVDDREENLLAMRALLEDLEINLVCVTSGMDALEAMDRERFALVLLDVNMPEMDGFETARLLRGKSSTRNTPIIFVTAAHTSELDVELGYATGAVDYLTKPVNPIILKSKVKIFVELAEFKNEVTRLRDIIPICCSCKQIRDDKGYWQRLESYFSEYGGAEFTHGICPDCAKELYPGVDIGE